MLHQCLSCFQPVNLKLAYSHTHCRQHTITKVKDMSLVCPAILWLAPLGYIGRVMRRRWQNTISSCYQQVVLAIATKCYHTTLSLLHGSDQRRGTVPFLPSHSDCVQLVKCVMVATSMATSPSKVVEILSNGSAGIVSHTQGRNATGRQLTPLSCLQAENLYDGSQLVLISTSVDFRKCFLPASPQVEPVASHHGAVAKTSRRLILPTCER